MTTFVIRLSEADYWALNATVERGIYDLEDTIEYTVCGDESQYEADENALNRAQRVFALIAPKNVEQQE